MKTKLVLALVLLSLLAIGSPAQQATPNRIALVIGAQNYSVLPPLHNSLNDAKAMTAKLRAKGFQVESVYDPKSKREIRDAINRYYNIMRDKVGAVGLIFYAGHGMQYEGDNYIIPTTATVQSPADLEDQCVKMNTVMAVLKSANKSLNILLLDACRSLPSFTRDTDQGLTRMEAPQGSIIVFAAQAGKTASDGTGTNGLFTSKLISVLDEPNLNITDVFKKVKQQVYAASGEKQLPSVEDNSIGGDFYFSGGGGVVSTPTNSGPTNSVVTKPEPVVERETVSAPFDYGYGSSDAPTVTVGSQAWLGKNLNVDHFANGEPIPEARTNDEWKAASDNGQPAWCYYNNDPGNGRTYSRLYNWYAVHDLRGLAPKGWHVPSDGEWNSITSYLGGEAAGSALKSTSGWESYNGVNGNGNNGSGIAGLPGGYRTSNGPFNLIGRSGDWWSSSEATSGEAWVRRLNSSAGRVIRYYSTKGCGFSVRCVRD